MCLAMTLLVGAVFWNDVETLRQLASDVNLSAFKDLAIKIYDNIAFLSLIHNMR